MNSRQRYRATCNFEPLDRYFQRDYGPWAITESMWRESGLPADWEKRNCFRMDELRRLDRRWIDLGGCAPPYFPPVEAVELKDEGETMIIRDSDLVMKRVFKVHPETSMPQFLEFPVKTERDWRRIMPLLHTGDSERYAHLGEMPVEVRSEDRSFPVILEIEGAYMRLRNLLGEENLAYAFFDAPEMLHDMLELWADLLIEGFEQLAGYILPDEIEWEEDLCYRSGPLLSPNHFRAFLLPRYERVIGAIKRASPGTLIDVDSDGNLAVTAPLFLEAGVDMLTPFEVAAGNDVVELRKRHPNLIIKGGIDKRCLAQGPDAIDRELDRVLPRMWEAGGYFPCIDHTIPPDVPLRHFEYYRERMREFRG